MNARKYGENPLLEKIWRSLRNNEIVKINSSIKILLFYSEHTYISYISNKNAITRGKLWPKALTKVT